MRFRHFAAAGLLLGLAVIGPDGPALAEETFTVVVEAVADQKAVFATIESRRIVPARARIAGTLAEMKIKEGDQVELGEVVAIVGDQKLALQLQSVAAQVAGLQAELVKAEADLTRAEDLLSRGTIPRVRVDDARAARDVAASAVRARAAERAVLEQQLSEGRVLAPAAGRVLGVPVTSGSVVMAGETMARLAERDFVLRLRVPERHARFLKAGDAIRVDAAELGGAGPKFGTIQLVYPQIEEGRVVADAVVDGLGDYFVNGRMRVWISAGARPTIVIPAGYIETRYGLDYVRIRSGNGIAELPVQRGRDFPRPDRPDGVEILSGLKAGDVLVRP